MPAVSRKDGVDAVSVPSHGTPNSCPPGMCCGFGSTIVTEGGSNNVIINTTGVVRKGDLHIEHPNPACVPHQTPLDTYSPNVFANGKEVGRIGDEYDSEAGPHILTTGSPNVFANGA